MVALEMRPGAAFHPEEAFEFFRGEQESGGMDSKWMPDYVRIVDAFSLTNTQKILVRPFKKEHFNLDATPGMKLHHLQRGDTAYRELTPAGYEEIRKRFLATGRQGLLEPTA